MNRKNLLAGAGIGASFILATLAAWPAHAQSVGQWMDTRNHLALRDLPDSDPSIAHLNYAKQICTARAGSISNPAYPACMKGEGFVWINDSPEQIAARQQADHDARTRAWLYSTGQALAGMARPMVVCQRLGNQVICQ